MITVGQAVESLRPGAEWTMSAGDVETIVWHTEGVEPLTVAEVDAEVKRLEKAETEALVERESARASAVEKLQALGLTVDEVQAAFGLKA